MKKILTSSAFIVPSILIFSGVTALYIRQYQLLPDMAPIEKIIYFVIYLIISLFLQFVIYVNAKRLYPILYEKDNQKH